MYGMFSGVNYIVNSVDSVIVDSTYHKKYSIKTIGSQDLEWFDIVEGVGSTLGLLTKIDYTAPNYNSDLVCFKHNNQGSYPTGGQCELYQLNQIDENNKCKIFIYPNPTKGVVIIDTGGKIIKLKVSLKNLVGQIVSNYDIINNHSFTIDINGPSGIYFLELKTDFGESIVYKIIKE